MLKRVLQTCALFCLAGFILGGCREEKAGSGRQVQTTGAGEKRAIGPPQAESDEPAPGVRGAEEEASLEEGGDGETKETEILPAPRPVAEGGLEEARIVLGDVAVPDSARLEAARRLLEKDVGFLAGAYGQRDNARIVRRLIEEKVAERDARIVPLLVRLFEKVGGEKRIDFEEYLLHFGRQAEGAMMEFLHARDRSLVMRAVDALVKMRSPAAADSIALLLGRPDSWIRIAAAHAMGELGGPKAVDRLVAVLDDTSYSVVDAALVGLGRLRAVSAYDRIVPLLESDIPHVRKHAAMALGELGDRRAVPAVRNLARNDPDPGVRFMAGRALKKLEENR